MSKPRSIPDAFHQPTRTDAEEPTSQANPLHDERGPMSNEHDPRTAVNHLTGGPMTKIARPTANPHTAPRSPDADHRQQQPQP
jgi:hypothetical protein